MDQNNLMSGMRAKYKLIIQYVNINLKLYPYWVKILCTENWHWNELGSRDWTAGYPTKRHDDENDKLLSLIQYLLDGSMTHVDQFWL